MKLLTIFFLVAGLLLTAMPHSASADTTGSYVTQILVDKSARKLYLLSGNRALRTYDIDLGFEPEGTKRFQGDGRTPEGQYYITHRNPNSAFFLSLGISYPNEQDRAYARARGQSPGGDIFLHGRGPRAQNAKKDWTWGCIAVTDAVMKEIWRYVTPGMPIYIKP